MFRAAKQPAARKTPVSVGQVRAGKGGGKADAPGLDVFLAAIGSVIVDPPVYHAFPGAIDREMASAIWAWIARDVASEEVARMVDAVASGAEPVAAFDTVLSELVERLKHTLADESENHELVRRNTIQMGGEDARKRLPYVIMAIRRRKLLDRAIEFGKALGNLQDEATLALALQTINISNPATQALWMQAMVGVTSNPSRVMAAASRISGGGDEIHITNGGFSPLVEAMLSHAQSQIAHLIAEPGVFSDLDLACKAIDRYHRLLRAVNHNLDIDRKSHWGTIIAELTGRISERLDRPMREISVNVTQSLRRPREGADRVDPDAVFEALNGLYLLITVRNCRDSLAVNALLEKAWTETGQAVEVLVTRALETYRAQPGDPVLRERLEAGIKMAEIRFNPEYAEILRRAMDGAERRTANSG